MSRDPAFFSHKSNSAGLNYELAISVFSNQLVWMSGPHPAGRSDIQVFRQEDGLKDKIPAGKKLIADNGYCGERSIISTPNSQDPQPVRKLKGRACSRHEAFNGKIKNFSALAEPFRHGINKHKIAFEAICIIVQYQLENGSPLFDV